AFKIRPWIDIRVGPGTITQIIALDARLGVTAVAVTVKHPTFVIDGDFVKVEKVAIAVLSAPTLLPNTGMILNRIIRCRVDRDPGDSFVVGRGDVGIPHPVEIPILV